MSGKIGKIMALMIVFSLTAVAGAFGEGNCVPSHEMREKMFGRMFRDPDLTETQQWQLKEHFKKTKQAREGIKTQMRSARRLLREELGKPDASADRVSMLTGILKDASAEGIDSRLNSLIQIKEILTPEQYREFLKRPQQHRTGKSKRRLDEKRYGRRHERRE